MALDVQFVRDQFPSLDSEAVFLDNPGGSQIARPSLDRMRAYLVDTNANRGGAFSTSQATDAILRQSRQAAADFLNAEKAEEIVFGPNMTTLAFTLSRALADRFSPSDEIIVTRLDHDANIAPWVQLAERKGCPVHWIDFDRVRGRLDMTALERAVNQNTKLIAVGYASNALGTINPVEEITQIAHQHDALCFVDAVQLAPHQPVDVRQLDCDFLALSAYKLFGPHIGLLYGKHELLSELPAAKVRPASDKAPHKFETGTQNHEGIAGLLGTMEYLAELSRFGGQFHNKLSEFFEGRILELKTAMRVINEYELSLTEYLLEQLTSIDELSIFGPATTEDRVPTVSFRLEGVSPRRVAELLADLGIYVWDGNFYALAVTEHLGLEESGGLVRVGLVHYNTQREVDQLVNGLRTIVAG
ncbi:MAG: cysteine desulfurase-like protein [Anaerolineales bacterium]